MRARAGPRAFGEASGGGGGLASSSGMVVRGQPLTPSRVGLRRGLRRGLFLAQAVVGFRAASCSKVLRELVALRR